MGSPPSLSPMAGFAVKLPGKILLLLPFCVINGIPKAWSVYNGQTELHAFLLKIDHMLCDLHRLQDAF